MKKTATVIIISLAAIMTACSSTRNSEPLPERSWNAFCTSRGYDPAGNDNQITDEYLDTWCGSTEEEAALNEANL